MLQILIFAVCVLIIGVGYCGKQLAIMAKIAAKEEDKAKLGSGIFVIMVLLAVLLALWAVMQGGAISEVMNQLLP